MHHLLVTFGQKFKNSGICHCIYLLSLIFGVLLDLVNIDKLIEFYEHWICMIQLNIYVLPNIVFNSTFYGCIMIFVGFCFGLISLEILFS